MKLIRPGRLWQMDSDDVEAEVRKALAFWSHYRFSTVSMAPDAADGLGGTIEGLRVVRERETPPGHLFFSWDGAEGTDAC